MLYLHWDLGLFPRQDIEMLRLFLTDVTISLLFLLLEQNLDPSSPTHVDFVGSYLQAGWTSSLMLEMCLLKVLVR